MLPEEKALALVKEFSRVHKGIKAKVVDSKNSEMTVSFSGLYCKTCPDNERFPSFLALLEGMLQKKVSVKEANRVGKDEFRLVYALETDPADDILKILDKYYEGVPPPQGLED